MLAARNKTIFIRYSKTQKSGQGSQFSELDFKQLHICLFLLAVAAQVNNHQMYLHVNQSN